MPLQVGELMILRGCAWMSRKRIFSSSRCSARCVWSRPVCLPSASQAFTATWPLVSGASCRITSQASMSVSIFGMPLVTPSSRVVAVELAELLDLGLRVPGDALAAVADLVHQRAERGEALVDVRVVALDHRDLRRGLAGDQLALAALPVRDLEGLAPVRPASRASAASAPLPFPRPGGRRRPR